MTLVWVAAAFILGVFIGFATLVPAWVLLTGLSSACLLLLLLRGHVYLRLTFLLLIPLLLGIGRSESARLHIGPGDLAYYNGRLVTLVGVVNAEPDVRDKGINYVIAVSGMQAGRGTARVTGQLELHTAPGQVLNEGDQIQLTGSLQTPVNSPQIPYKSILANRGIYSQMAFPRLFVTGHVSLGLVGLAGEIRQWIENSISQALPEPEASLLIAILIGSRSAQLGSLAPVLIHTGLIHLIAVSGIKIAIVAGTVNTALRRFLSRTPTLLLSTLTIFTYWLISGATVAGLRASIMWLLVFVAAYLGRPTFALVSLGLAASVMLAVTPALLWDTGFELTTLATASIVAFSPLLERLTSRLPTALAASISTTTAAQIGVLPVQILSFHIVSPVSLLTNAVVLPFIPLTMVVGFAMVIVPHAPLTEIAFSLVHVLVVVATWAARLPGTTQLTSIPLVASLAYYGLLSGLAILAWRIGTGRRRHVRGEWIFGLSVATLGLGIALHAPTSHNRLLFLTNGDALLTSHGQNVLIDGGASPSKLLSALGAALPFPNNHLDAVIDTDPRSKNVASLLQVVEHLRVGEVVDPGIEYPSQTYARWRAWLWSHRIPCLALRPGLALSGQSFSIHALAPDGLYSNPKDGAGALLITVGAKRALYLGPASPREQQDLPFQTNVTAETLITAAPVDPVFKAAVRYEHLVRPQAGSSLPLTGL